MARAEWATGWSGCLRRSLRARGTERFENLCLENLGFQWVREQESLNLSHVIGPQEIHLADRFDALGESLQSEILAQLDERLGEAVMALVNDLSILMQSMGNWRK